MKKESLIIIVLLISLSSCSKNEESPKIGMLSPSSFRFNFSLRDNNNERAWESYDSYLSDSTQSPHSPYLKWENGEKSEFEFLYVDSVTVPDYSGPIFYFRASPYLFDRIFESGADSCATGYVYWNDQRVDTFSLYAAYRVGEVNDIEKCEIITYNSDTIFEKNKMYTNQSYYDLASTNVLIVNIKSN